MTMKMVNIAEAKAQLSELLDAATAGERVVICKRNEPVAEIRPVPARRTSERPLGLAAESVTLTPAFFDPLPESVLASFERPEIDKDAVRRANRVAEPRRAPFGRAGTHTTRQRRTKR